MTNAGWAAIGKCPADTALWDIDDLLPSDVLAKLERAARRAEYGVFMGEMVL